MKQFLEFKVISLNDAYGEHAAAVINKELLEEGNASIPYPFTSREVRAIEKIIEKKIAYFPQSIRGNLDYEYSTIEV